MPSHGFHPGVGRLKASDIKVCILRMEGTNNEQEMQDAFLRAGTRAELVHLKQVLGKTTSVGSQRDLANYQVLIFPGGWSAGDYVRAGAIFAARLKAEAKKDLKAFVEEGKAVGGMCNGFQVLVELGLLPQLGDGPMSSQPEAALSVNDSDRFECRPTYLRVESTKCAFTQSLKKGEVLYVPSAHGEGKFTLPPEQEAPALARLEEEGRIVFRFVNPATGTPDGYPFNPNGSPSSIAAVCNAAGNVFGIMPHPERSYLGINHPDWYRKSQGEWGDGKRVFDSVIAYTTRRF
jgi:phosphoribosylformylglycinamidine synthase subunit PurQ / glutaminase